MSANGNRGWEAKIVAPAVMNDDKQFPVAGMRFAKGRSMTGRLLAVAVLTALISAACEDDPSTIPTGPTSQSPSTSSGSAASPQGVQTGCRVPAAPSNLRVTSIARTTVELTWNAVPGATSYTLMVGSRPGGTDELLSDTSQTSFRFTARDGRSFARVQAHNACGPGPSTGSIEFFIPG